MLYIQYTENDSGLYARAVTTLDYRVGKRKVEDNRNSLYLGRVCDKERNIFYNKVRGYFSFDPAEERFLDPPEDFKAAIHLYMRLRRDMQPYYLSYGDVFYLNALLHRTNLQKRLDGLAQGDRDTFFTALYYYILNPAPLEWLPSWYKGSFISSMYPSAVVDPDRLRNYLRTITPEKVLEETRQMAWDNQDECALLLKSPV